MADEYTSICTVLNMGQDKLYFSTSTKLAIIIL